VLAVGAGLLVVLAALAVLLAPGDFRSYPRAGLLTAARRAAAPAWTKPCWASAPSTEQQRCEHVSGRVVWVQKHDPDGDGDRHLLIIGRLHPRIVKLSAHLPLDRLPRIGAHVDAVGWLMTGASGRGEVDTERFVWAGTVKTTQSGAAVSPIAPKALG
jgi:hypothetical protein